jgi:hypothetical protein
MTENDINTFDHLIEPPYNLERGRLLNEESAKHDPAFKVKMEESRVKAAKAAASQIDRYRFGRS